MAFPTLISVFVCCGHVGAHASADYDHEGVVLLQTRAGKVKKHVQWELVTEVLESLPSVPAISLGVMANATSGRDAGARDRDTGPVTPQQQSHAGEDCWNPCAQKGGHCAWCGEGGMCCRKGWKLNPPECQGVTSFRTAKHECVVRGADATPPAKNSGNQEAAPATLHLGEDCWSGCGQKGGLCEFCGQGNSCCRRGWAQNPSECLAVTSYLTSRHECVAPANYNYEEGQICGDCGEANQLHVGIGGLHFDSATATTAAHVCGPVCDQHEDCLGFNYVESSKRCYYRRSTACKISTDADGDCYSKKAWAGEGSGNAASPERVVRESYVKDGGRMCGKCGNDNNLKLGDDGQIFDVATRGTALEMCGLVCQRSGECGGFTFVDTLGRCFYRRITSCHASEDSESDCYSKISSVQNQSEPAYLAARTEQLQEKLKQKEAALQRKKATIAHLTSELESVGADSANLLSTTSNLTFNATSHSPPLTMANAPLNSSGYSLVAGLNSTAELSNFVRRAAQSKGCRVTNEGGFQGFLPYYADAAENSYDSLTDELEAICMLEDGWLARGAALIETLEDQRIETPTADDGAVVVVKLLSNDDAAFGDDALPSSSPSNIALSGDGLEGANTTDGA